MNSQDMSIYWNQRKGQYETNNFYGAQQQQQNPFTITADRRLKYTEEAVEEEENEEASVSIGSWLGTLFLMIIPVINIFALIGMAASSKNENKKAFARAMGINENITSPTFNIIKEYAGDMKLFHMDVYRLSDIKQDIGIEEYFTKKGICIIEWSDLIEDILPKNRLNMKFRMVDENTRQIVITPHGSKYEDLCERVL